MLEPQFAPRGSDFLRSTTRLAAGLWLATCLAALPARAAATPSEDQSPASSPEVMVPMRDGVALATDVYLPEGPGPWPAILQRTPYDKARSTAPERYTARGYALVVQDQRGRYRSAGTYNPHENELNDGYDTVEWVATQRWSDGKVGVSGASALGIAANLAAAADPPHLVAAYVVVAPESLFFEGRFIGGVFKEADTGNWMRGQGVAAEAIDAYKRRVLLDPRWLQTDLIFLRHNIDVPIYNVGGWYDLFLLGTINNFRYLQEWGRPGAQGNQKVMIGPFGHGAVRGELEYPDAGDRRSVEEELRWFDYWLKGLPNGIMDEPPVRYYMRAAAKREEPSPKNGWRTADAWPPDGVSARRLYLYADRQLRFERPAAESEPSRYRFDPASPVPTVGGLNLTLPLGPMDQRTIGERADYLRFETAPLEQDLVLAGKLDLELWVSTDAPDTDFMAKLVDVYPDGYEALVIDGAQRLRYRHGRRPEDVSSVESNEPTRIGIDLWHTALVFERGHRLAVHVTSSNTPRFEVNPNTGDPPGEALSRPRVATNAVYHDAVHASAIVLPVLDEQ